MRAASSASATAPSPAMNESSIRSQDMTPWSEIREGLLFAFDAIWANKLRSVLTTLGIVIGIVTVTLMGTAIEGMNRAFVKNISGIGADVLYVTRGSWFIDSHDAWLKVQKRPPLTLACAEALEKQLTLAQA